MAMQKVTDDRVKIAVERRISYGRGLTKYTQKCPKGYSHVAHVDDGTEEWDDLGFAFDIVSALR